MQTNGIDDASDVEIVVRLENDDELVVLHAFRALTWVAFKTSDELRAVPMTAVHEVRSAIYESRSVSICRIRCRDKPNARAICAGVIRPDSISSRIMRRSSRRA